MKGHLNRGEEPRLLFYRDEDKVGVDLLDFTDSGNRRLVEIQSGQTYRDSFVRSINKVGDALDVPCDGRCVVARVESGFTTKSGVAISSASEWLRMV